MLREIIYPEVKKTDQTQYEIKGFSVKTVEELKFIEKIAGNEKINQLLIMTPHFYRASKKGRLAAASLEELEITVDVIFRVLEKT